MSLWATKPISVLRAEADQAGEHSLQRALGPLNLVTLGIGAIIGAGIFVLTGQAAALHAGPAVWISMILVGIACAFAGLCYAEMASAVPVAGSAYTYAYATMGELVAWIIGWDLVLEYAAGAATVGVGWSGHLVSLLEQLGIVLPPHLTNAPTQWCTDAQVNVAAGCAHSGLNMTGALVNLPAVFIVALMSTILVIGIKESAKVNNLIVILKVAIVLLIVGVGLAHVDTGNWTPLIPPNTGEWGTYGWSGVLRAAGLVFFAYIGFDAVSTAAQEAKNPQRDLPIGMLGSLAICTVLYILMALVMTGMAHYTDLNVPHPVFVALETAGEPLAWLRYFVNIGAIAGLASVVLVMLMGQPRIFYSMSRDGLLPPVFSKVHPRFRTPYVTTILTGCVAALVAGFFPIGLLGELVSIGTLLAFVIVCAGTWYLRVKEPNRERPFKTPLVPLVPILGILTCGFMMYFLPLDTWLRLIVWMLLGIVIYFAYGRSHSLLQRTGHQVFETEPSRPTYTHEEE
jgi:APA family basic amino acid/polyamine antiporter